MPVFVVLARCFPAGKGNPCQQPCLPFDIVVEKPTTSLNITLGRTPFSWYFWLLFWLSDSVIKVLPHHQSTQETRFSFLHSPLFLVCVWSQAEMVYTIFWVRGAVCSKCKKCFSWEKVDCTHRKNLITSQRKPKTSDRWLAALENLQLAQITPWLRERVLSKPHLLQDLNKALHPFFPLHFRPSTSKKKVLSHRDT